jgi:hypothetical protein
MSVIGPVRMLQAHFEVTDCECINRALVLENDRVSQIRLLCGHLNIDRIIELRGSSLRYILRLNIDILKFYCGWLSDVYA